MGFVSWIPNAGGDWDTAANWSTGALPTSADQVTISTTTIQTITHSEGNDYAGSLAVGNDIFEMEAGTLGVVSSAAFGSGFSLTGGAMSVGSTMSINGGATAISGGTLSVGTTLKIVGALDQSGGNISAKSVTVTGTAQLLGGSLGGVTIFQASGLITLANYAFLGSSELKNAHTLDQTGSITLGDDSGVNATILNEAGATYNFDNSVTIVSGAATAEFLNSGTLVAVAETGTSTINVQATSTGTISIATGSTLAFAGALTSLGGTITGAGTLSLAGGVTTLAAGATFNVASLTLSGNGATLALGGSETLSGGFSQSNGSVLQLNGHTLTLAGMAQFYGSPEISGGGALVTDGATGLEGGLAIGGGVTWDNSGTVNDINSFQIGDNSGTAATVMNAAGGVFDLAAGGVSIDSGVGNDSFVNAGTLAMQAGSGTSDVYVNLSSTGTVSAAGGDNLEIDGASNSIGGTITGAGSVSFGAGSTTLAAAATINVAWLQVYGSGTTLTLGGNETIAGNFYQGGGALLQLNGHTLTLASEAVFSGSPEISGGGTLVTDGATSVNGGLAIGGGVTWDNSGTVNDISSFQIGDNSGTAATVMNAAGAVFDLAVGNIAINGAVGSDSFVNAGLLEVTAVSGVDYVYTAVFNSGAITAMVGTLQFEGALSNSGSINANDGDININGNIINKSTIRATNDGSVYINGALTNTGTITASAGSYVGLGGGGTLGGTIGGGGGSVVLTGIYSVVAGKKESVKFLSGASFAATGSNTAYLSGTGTIATSGTVAIGYNGGWSLWLENDVIWQNAGTVNDAGNIRFGDSGGDSVTLDNVAGAAFNVSAEGLIFQNAGTIANLINAGTFVKSAGTGVSDIQIAFTNSGTIAADSGTLEFDGGGTLGGTIGGGAGEVVLDGNFGVATGATETVKFGSGVSLAAPGTNTAYFEGDGTIATGGTVAIGNNGGVALWLYNLVTWQNLGVVNDAGDIRFGSGGGDNATLDNASGATFNVSAEGAIFQNYGTTANVVNAGTFVKSAGTGISDIQIAFTNTGTVAADSGTLELDYFGSNTGTAEALASATLYLQNQTLANAGGVIEAIGAGAIINLNSETINGGALKTSGGGLIEAVTGSSDTLNGVGVGAGSAATLAGGGTMTLTGTSKIAGTLTLTGTTSLDGTLSGAGTLAMAGGGAATIASGATLSVAKWSLSGAGTVATLGETLAYKGAFSEGAGATLSLTGGALTLTGSASLKGGTVDGSDDFSTDGTTSVSSLTIGGTVEWEDAAMTTESGGSLILGDTSGSAAMLSIASTGTWDITDKSGIASGASAASEILNAGLFEKTVSTTTSVINPAIVNTGTISAAAGTLDLHGALSGTGADQIGAGATLEVDAAVAATQTFTYEAGGGDLALDDLDIGGAQLFKGKVSGWGTGDTLDAGAPFGTGTTFVFTENSGHTGGTLALTDGKMHASISFLGNYATSNFTPTSDGHGGTLFTFHA